MRWWEKRRIGGGDACGSYIGLENGGWGAMVENPKCTPRLSRLKLRVLDSILSITLYLLVLPFFIPTKIYKPGTANVTVESESYSISFKSRELVHL